MSAEIIHGDSKFAIQLLPSNSVDSIVTDPPYALVSIQKRFGKPGSKPAKDVYGRGAAGFMGKQWDTGEVAFSEEFWAECLRVLKPGGHVLAFGGTRTYHRLACAVEDGGFEIRDQIGWLYGSGFPKSHNQDDEWEGWGTALKPAWEPIVVARKALDGTVAANLAKWGVGALNIDGCRVPGEKPDTTRGAGGQNGRYAPIAAQGRILDDGKGRWPANIVHDGSDEVVAAFPDAPGQMAKAAEGEERRKDQNVYGAMTRGSNGAAPRIELDKSAARFFYCAKASRKDRDEGLEQFEDKRGGAEQFDSRWKECNGELRQPVRKNTHPTVKPTALMQWLCRLVTPPGGLVLDPFMGSGSTGRGAVMEGFRFVGIEMTEEYLPIARARIAAAQPKGVFG